MNEDIAELEFGADLNWERIYTNAAGKPLPWPAICTSIEELSLATEKKNLQSLGEPIYQAFMENLAEDEEELLWSGTVALSAISNATLGDQRSIFAVTTEDMRDPYARHSPSEYALWRDPKERPAIIVLRASAFIPDTETGSKYQLRPEIPNLDNAVAGLLIFSSEKARHE